MGQPSPPECCIRCGQLSDRPVCDACRDLERESQGQAVRLFTPAPAQLPGQLSMGELPQQ